VDDKLKLKIVAVLKQHGPLTGYEIGEKICEEKVKNRELGLITSVVSLFSEKSALTLLTFFSYPNFGALYPTLLQLEDSKKISSNWIPGSRPRKRLYRLAYTN
jgi:DNA-binding PadR family transcriptional regulator